MHVELIAKTLIVNTDGDILVLQRSLTDDYRPGEWDLPGGGVNPAEDLRLAAIREAKEETGLTIQNLQPIHVASKIDGQRHVVKTVFVARDPQGTLRLSHEHCNAAWLTPAACDRITLSIDYKNAIKMMPSASLTSRL